MPAERRGIVLAAGRGSRLGRLTASRPKCLLPLAGRPLLDWQLGALAAAGVAPRAIVRGYRAATIARPGLHTFDNPDWARGNMVASLRCAHAWLSSAPCVVGYGDIVFHPDTVRLLCETTGDVAITYDLDWRSLWAARFARPEDDAETLRVVDGRLAEIGQRIGDLGAVEGQYMGLLHFTPAGWHAVERVLGALDADTCRALAMTQLLQLLVERGVRVAAIPVRGRWCEVDSASDLALYESLLATPGWRHDWRGGWTMQSPRASSAARAAYR